MTTYDYVRWNAAQAKVWRDVGRAGKHNNNTQWTDNLYNVL